VRAPIAARAAVRPAARKQARCRSASAACRRTDRCAQPARQACRRVRRAAGAPSGNKAPDSRREDAGEAGPSLIALAMTFCRCKKLVRHVSPGSLSVSDHFINDRSDMNVALALPKFLYDKFMSMNSSGRRMSSSGLVQRKASRRIQRGFTNVTVHLM